MSRAIARADRIPLDAYYTPDDVALACVRTLPDLGGAFVLEPSVGGGAFVRAIRSVSIPIVIAGIDVNPDAPGFGWCDEVFHGGFVGWSDPWGRSPDWIIGNPPYSEAEPHVRRALSLAPNVAMLLRLAFLESEKRRTLWAKHPPASVHVLSRRPSFTGGGTDSAAYGWFVWRRDHVGAPTLGWIA